MSDEETDTPQPEPTPKKPWELKRVEWEEMLVTLHRQADDIEAIERSAIRAGLREEPLEWRMREVYVLRTVWQTLGAIEPFREELRDRIVKGQYDYWPREGRKSGKKR